MSTSPTLADLGIEPHVSLAAAARLLGVAHRTLLRGLGQGTMPALQAKKVLGRWRVPVSAIQTLYAEPAPASTKRATAMLQRVDYPNLTRVRRGRR